MAGGGYTGVAGVIETVSMSFTRRLERHRASGLELIREVVV